MAMQTRHFMKFASWTFIFYQIIILLLVLGGSITFGNGLGDLGMIIVYGFVILILTLLNIWALRTKKLYGSKFLALLSFIFGLISVFSMTLYFTIWRGSEYPWNGNIFISSLNQSAEQSKKDSISNVNRIIATDRIMTNPNDIKAYIDRARISKSDFKYEEAINDYNKALKIDSNNFSANFEIGEMYWNLNDYKTALKYNEKALSIDTGYFLTKHRIKMLKEQIKMHSH